MSWIAEDVPWYSVDPSTKRAYMTDEDYAMSAPKRLGEFASETEARKVVADQLVEISTFNFVVRGGETEKYQAAAQAILSGVDGVKVYGRFHRVREV